jgi:hypothetical protein
MRFVGRSMAMTADDEIEAKARALLRETIERAGWYPSLRRIEREKRIAQDVDLHWHLIGAGGAEAAGAAIRQSPGG